MPRSKVTVDFSSLRGKITNIKKELSKEKTGAAIANAFVDNIRNNSISPKTGKKYKGLKSSTVRNRKYLAKNNKTHPNYSANKPNLTITGRLLDSIKAKVNVTLKSISYEIDVTGSHARYKSNEGAPIGKKAPKNSEIREGLSKIGRDPLGISKKLEKEIFSFLKAEVTKRI